MSTYLVALAVGDFVCSAGSADGIPIQVCSTPDKKGQTGLALEAAAEVMRYYNKYYDVKYPFKKLDIVARAGFRRRRDGEHRRDFLSGDGPSCRPEGALR